ncbi:AEC family transporter [Yoonia sp. SS1-5]|uniref:AEC family transporter n=1 Tax=Yoonia rhodophyticola TaxID=3137370 RepID=A0AAN0MCN9_9RHOB
MWEIFLKTLPFFMLIALGYGAGRLRFFTPEATAYLTKFVFYFALSAMIFRFAASLQLEDILNWPFVFAYLAGSGAVYVLATAVAMWRGLPVAQAAVEAQCAVIGNVGFLGIPMLALLLGDAAVGPIMMVLAVDLIIFGSLIVILITGSRDGRMSPAIILTVATGLIKNPMIVSMLLGLAVSAYAVPIPVPVNEFLTILGAAATPGALFAIGASLATKSAERMVVAGWLSLCKLVLHPAAVAIMCLFIFDVAPYAAGVMIAAAALPVAGNVYIIAQHYGVAPARVSAAILISTILSILTVSAVIAWVTSL